MKGHYPLDPVEKELHVPAEITNVVLEWCESANYGRYEQFVTFATGIEDVHVRKIEMDYYIEEPVSMTITYSHV